MMSEEQLELFDSESEEAISEDSNEIMSYLDLHYPAIKSLKESCNDAI